MGSYFALHICQYFTVMFDQQNNAIVCIGSLFHIFRTLNPFYVAKKRDEEKRFFYVNVCRAGKALYCERLAQWLRCPSLPHPFSFSLALSLSVYLSAYIKVDSFKKPLCTLFLFHCWHIYSVLSLYLSEKRAISFVAFSHRTHFFLRSAFHQNI